MQIDPALRALRDDAVSQRQAQAALETERALWRAGSCAAPLLADLAEWGQGAALTACPAMSALVADPARALTLVEDLVAGQLRELADHPLGQIPFRHQLDERVAIIQLASANRATLSLLAYPPSAGPGDETAITFSDAERIEIVLAGEASGEILTIAEDRGRTARFARAPLALNQGSVLHLAGDNRAKRFLTIARPLVLLRMTRTPPMPGPTRQYDLASGALVHRASGDRRESRLEMALTVLARMKRADAAPVLAEMTIEGSDHLRWQALRECLALDTATGFVALARMARRPSDPLAAQARALEAQLTAAYPALAALSGDQPCPA